VLGFTETVDALDYARSEFTYRDDGSIRFIKRWCFKEPPGGLPAIFKVKERAGLALISLQARPVLEKGDFKGIRIKPQNKIGLP
jgi:hypothetical protein